MVLRMDIRAAFFGSVLLLGCTTTRPERLTSTVAEARLCLEAGVLQPGQRFRVERRSCEGPACTLDPVARGEVLRVVDDRCAIVRLASGVSIHRGDKLELSPTALSARAAR
jgi:hypothetical protein